MVIASTMGHVNAMLVFMEMAICVKHVLSARFLRLLAYQWDLSVRTVRLDHGRRRQGLQLLVHAPIVSRAPGPLLLE